MPVRQLVRRAVAMLAASGILLVMAGCVTSSDPSDSSTRHWPLGIPITVVARCEQSVGLGGSDPLIDIWRDSQGVHVQIGVGSRYAVGSSVSTTESALQSCLMSAAGSVVLYPTNSAGLTLLWKYSRTVLWPCFAEHGVDVGSPPARATFLRGDPLALDPFYLIRSPASDPLLTHLRRDCPVVPAYLRPASRPTPAPVQASG